jgi:soluble lytic murein transglycosylase-like protein
MSTQERLKPYADSVADRYGIPREYFSGFIGAESGWNTEARSDKGALGIVQIIPKYHPDVNPYDPYESIDYAGATIAGYFEKFGSWREAFAAWNAGVSSVEKYQGVPPYRETQNFVDKIVGNEPSISPTATPAVTVAQSNSFWWVAIIGAVLIFLGFSNAKKRR